MMAATGEREGTESGVQQAQYGQGQDHIIANRCLHILTDPVRILECGLVPNSGLVGVALTQ